MHSEVPLSPALLAIICIVSGYAVGMIPTGLILGRLAGVNLRQTGSGNIGATNVLRTLGVVPAIIVVLMDPLKAALITLVPQWLDLSPWVIAATAFAVVLGNTFNATLGFSGGKGVATSIGAFAAVDPLLAVLAIVIGLYVIFLSRMVSLGALTGMFSAPVLVIASGNRLTSTIILIGLLVAVVTIKHHDNIARLAAGTERRIGDNKPAG